MKKQIPIMNLEDFTEYIFNLKISDNKKLNAIYKYSKIINESVPSNIWEVNELGYLLYCINGFFGYYEFDDSRKGNFKKISKINFKKYSDKKLVYGKGINFIHEGKMMVGDKNYFNRGFISNVTPFSEFTTISTMIIHGGKDIFYTKYFFKLLEITL